MIGAELTFALSSLGIVGMILLKAFELRTGKESWMTRLSDNTNHKIHDAYAAIRRFFSYFNKQNAILLLRFIIIHAIIIWRKVWNYVKGLVMSHPKAQKMHDMITGKGVIKKKGAVSFFLKRIAEEAEDMSNSANPAPEVLVNDPLSPEK